ncbi:4Fe-4S single cluster domain-containing protein [Dactylosporangium sp. CA-139066]|uniref:4Fe-4S single cluster domain-containing protein n=1 Tax=Dactylosporangium sp. CA-139066 TaxID=3239930 RepID=UPI003D8D810B
MNPATIRLNRTRYPVEVLGHGRRLALWTQGCPLACKGCMSVDTWEPDEGEEHRIADLSAFWQGCLDDGADGLTVSGGEPLTQPVALRALLDEVDVARRRRPGHYADILVYTGYELHELDETQLAALEHVDVLIAGRYEADKPTRLPWRGSANQAPHLRTAEAEERYAERIGTPAERPEMQVYLRHDGQLVLVGIPGPGDLARLERALRVAGMTIESTTWRRRPPSRRRPQRDRSNDKEPET